MAWSVVPHYSTLFIYVNDINDMRDFYTDIIGMEETFFDNDRGWLTYDSNGLQLVMIRAAAPLPVNEDWAKCPGYADSGEAEIPSWVLTIPDIRFDVVIQHLKDGKAPLLGDIQEPQPGHRQVMTRDPMGTNIEVYAVRDE